MSRRQPRRANDWTVGSLVEEGSRRFRSSGLEFGHGTLNARDEALYLTLHALKLSLDAKAAILTRRVSTLEARRVLNLFRRRVLSRKPAAYLTREAWLGPWPQLLRRRTLNRVWLHQHRFRTRARRTRRG